MNNRDGFWVVVFWVGVVVLLAAAVAGVLAFESWILMLLWNWLVTDLFGAKAVTFWQAAGLAVLLSIIGGAFKCSRRGSE